MDFSLEEFFRSSPPLFALMSLCVVMLWRKLEAREKKHDEVMLSALAEVTSAVRGLTEELHRRK